MNEFIPSLNKNFDERKTLKNSENNKFLNTKKEVCKSLNNTICNNLVSLNKYEDIFISNENSSSIANVGKYDNDFQNLRKSNNIISELKLNKDILNINKYEFENEEVFSSTNDLAESLDSINLTYDDADEKEKKNDFNNNDDKHNCEVIIRIKPRKNIKINEDEIKNISYHDDKNIKYNNNCIYMHNTNFLFDRVFPEETKQEEVYSYLSNKFLNNLFEGYNCTIFAYGQTGSGKTFTMGFDYMNEISDNIGILPRFLDDMYKIIEKKKRNNINFDVSCTYIEIYNEEIVDLIDFDEVSYDVKLNKKNGKNKKKSKINKNISIREDINKKEIILMGIKNEKVENVQDVFSILHKGNLYRTTEKTFMNDKSSRSHAIFTINLIQRKNIIEKKKKKEEKNNEISLNNNEKNEDYNDNTMDNVNNGNDTNYENDKINKEEIICSKFHFVDLAGSERAKRTETQGNRLKEAININYGLLSLSNVIYSLSNYKKNQHIPYRNSKLTRILQDSLGGNSKTVMIACISIDPKDFYETLSTIKYASRTKKIKNNPIINYDVNSLVINELRKQLYNLNLELKKYKVGSKDKSNELEINAKFKEIIDQNNMLIQKIKKLQKKRKKLICLIFYYLTLLKNENKFSHNTNENSNTVIKQDFFLNFSNKKEDCCNKNSNEVEDFHDKKIYNEVSKSTSLNICKSEIFNNHMHCDDLKNSNIINKVNNYNLSCDSFFLKNSQYISDDTNKNAFIEYYKLIHEKNKINNSNNNYNNNDSFITICNSDFKTSDSISNNLCDLYINKNNNEINFEKNSKKEHDIIINNNSYDINKIEKSVYNENIFLKNEINESNKENIYKNNNQENNNNNGNTSNINDTLNKIEEPKNNTLCNDSFNKNYKICELCEKKNTIGNEDYSSDFNSFEKTHLFVNFAEDKKNVEKIFRQYELNHYNEKKLKDLNKKYNILFEKNKSYEKKIEELKKVIKRVKKYSKTEEKNKKKKKKMKKNVREDHYNSNLLKKLLFHHMNENDFFFKYKRNCFSDVEFEREIKNKMLTHFIKKKSCSDTEISNKNDQFFSYIKNNCYNSIKKMDVLYNLYIDHKKGKFFSLNKYCNNITENNYKDGRKNSLESFYSSENNSSSKFFYSNNNIDTNYFENKDKISDYAKKGNTRKKIMEGMKEHNYNKKIKKKNLDIIEYLDKNKIKNYFINEQHTFDNSSNEDINYSNNSPKFLKNKLYKLQKIIKEELSKFKKVNKEKEEYNAKNELLTNNIMNLKKKLHYLQVNSQTDKNSKKIENMKNEILKITNEKQKIQKKLNDNEQKIKHLKVDIMKMKNNFLKTSKILKEEQRKHNNIIRKKENIITKLHEREEIFINKLKKKEEINKQAYSKLLKRNQELNEELRKLKKRGTNNKLKKKKKKKVENSTDINKDKEIPSSKYTDKKKLYKTITSDEIYDTTDSKNYELRDDFIMSSSSILSNGLNDSYLNSNSSFYNLDDFFSDYSPFKYSKEENLYQYNSKKDIKVKNYLKGFLKKKKKLSSIKLKLEKEKDMNKYIRKVLQALYLKKKNENEHLSEKNSFSGGTSDKKMKEIKDNIEIKECNNLNENQNIDLVENKEHNLNKDNEDLVFIKSYVNEFRNKDIDNSTYIYSKEKIDDDVLYYENKLSQSNELIKKLKKHFNTKREESILQKNVKYLLKQLYYNFKKRKENEKKVKSLKKFIYSENLFISKIYNNFFYLSNTINNSNISIYNNYLNNIVHLYSNEINNVPSKSKNLNLSNIYNSKENNTIDDILLLHNYENYKKDFSKNLNVSLFDSKRRHTFSSPRELGENSEKNSNTINLKKRSYKSRLMENIYLDHFNKKRIILSKNSNFFVNNDYTKYNKRYSDCLNLNKNVNNYSYVNKTMTILKSLDNLNNFEKVKYKSNLGNENFNLNPLEIINNKNNRNLSTRYICENKEIFDKKLFYNETEDNILCNYNVKRKTIDNCFLYINKDNNENFYHYNNFSDCNNDKEKKNEKKKDFIEQELKNNLCDKYNEEYYEINTTNDKNYSYNNIYDTHNTLSKIPLNSTDSNDLLKDNKNNIIFSHNENNFNDLKVIKNNSSDSIYLNGNSYICKNNIRDNHEINNTLIKNYINNEEYSLNNILEDNTCTISDINNSTKNTLIQENILSVNNDNSKSKTKIKKSVSYDKNKEHLNDNKFDFSIVSKKTNICENEKDTNLKIAHKLDTHIFDGVKNKEQRKCHAESPNSDNKKYSEHNKNISKEKDKNLNNVLDEVNFIKKENITNEDTKNKKKVFDEIEEIKINERENSTDSETNVVKKENINNFIANNSEDRIPSNLINKTYSTQLGEDTILIKEKSNINYNEVVENNLLSGLNKVDMKKKESTYDNNINFSKNKINDSPTVGSLNNLNIIDSELEGKIINNSDNIGTYDNLSSQRNYKTICIKNCHKYGVSGLCVKEINNKKLKFLSSSINNIKLWDDNRFIWNYDHNVLKNEKSTFINSLIISFQNNCFFAGINSYVHLFDIRMNPNFIQKYYYSDKNDTSLLISLLNNKSDYIPLVLRNNKLPTPYNFESKCDSNLNSFSNNDDTNKNEENFKIGKSLNENNSLVINENRTDNENCVKIKKEKEEKKCYNIINEMYIDEDVKDKLKTLKEVEKFQSEYCICACGSENFIKVFDIRKNDDNMWLAKVPITNKIEYITHIPIKKNIKNIIKDSNILKNIIIASRDKTVKIWKKGWVSFYPPSYDWCTSLSHFDVNDLMNNKYPFNFINKYNENKDDLFNYDSLIVSGSRDSHLRFWLYSNDNTTNEFNRFMKIIKNAHLVDITSISKYQHNNFITTDRDGYIQIWNCNLSFNEGEKSLPDLEFYKNQLSLTVNKIGKTFRHSSTAINKIVCYENNFLTASSDGSIKMFCEK
ncbi:conserved Plasmodium protein, unknown function [Plasmodium gallinaceum]|uniref:Kinesin motor domain-containing protein n=1 Tax=Plasmodium gallinaceum TaxID=5849 RepID=A0A1J1GP19_PLAGA|nr:conserved Plasmodium protein, unknown function [Plasmodium gallinaceum]CRG94157.1 conserved Plasmodium protein, unknown function [Plasmodium gallinaceum]